MAPLRDWFGRRERAAEETTWEDPRRNAERTQADRIADCADRQYVVVRGVIDHLTEQPRDTVNWLEARLTDGSGSLNLVWMGRRSIPGIEIGRELRAEGRTSDSEGQRKIYNPLYTLL